MVHVGIIPDGNRRWMKENNKSEEDLLNRWKDMLLRHLKYKVINYDNAKLEAERKEYWDHIKDINELSIYVLSIDNFNRQDRTKNNVFEFIKFISELDVIFDFNICLHGNPKLLPLDVIDNIEKIINKCNIDSKFVINLAVVYDPIEDLKHCLTDKTRKQTQIDVVFRSGREIRTSGFFPYYTLYSEWIFCDKLWPDVTEDDISDAIKCYKARIRRYGK